MSKICLKLIASIIIQTLLVFDTFAAPNLALQGEVKKRRSVSPLSAYPIQAGENRRVDFVWAGGGKFLNNFPKSETVTLSPKLFVNTGQFQKIFLSQVNAIKDESLTPLQKVSFGELIKPKFLKKIKAGDYLAYSKLIEALYLYRSINDSPKTEKLKKIYSKAGVNISFIASEISRRLSQESVLVKKYKEMMKTWPTTINKLASQIDEAFLKQNNFKKVSPKRAEELIAILRYIVYFKAEGSLFKLLEFSPLNVYAYQSDFLIDGKTYDIEHIIFKFDKEHYLPDGAVNYELFLVNGEPVGYGNHVISFEDRDLFLAFNTMEEKRKIISKEIYALRLMHLENLYQATRLASISVKPLQISDLNTAIFYLKLGFMPEEEDSRAIAHKVLSIIDSGQKNGWIPEQEFKLLSESLFYLEDHSRLQKYKPPAIASLINKITKYLTKEGLVSLTELSYVLNLDKEQLRYFIQNHMPNLTMESEGDEESVFFKISGGEEFDLTNSQNDKLIQARMLIKEHKYNEAITLLKRIQSYYPASLEKLEILFLLGDIYHRLQKNTEATNYFEDALNTITALNLFTKRQDEEIINKLINQKANLLLLLGMIYNKRLHRPDAALRYLKKLEELNLRYNLSSWDTYLEIIYAHFHKKDLFPFLSYSQKLLRLKPPLKLENKVLQLIERYQEVLLKNKETRPQDFFLLIDFCYEHMDSYFAALKHLFKSGAPSLQKDKFILRLIEFNQNQILVFKRLEVLKSKFSAVYLLDYYLGRCLVDMAKVFLYFQKSGMPLVSLDGKELEFRDVKNTLAQAMRYIVKARTESKEIEDTEFLRKLQQTFTDIDKIIKSFSEPGDSFISGNTDMLPIENNNRKIDDSSFTIYLWDLLSMDAKVEKRLHLSLTNQAELDQFLEEIYNNIFRNRIQSIKGKAISNLALVFEKAMKEDRQGLIKQYLSFSAGDEGTRHAQVARRLLLLSAMLELKQQKKLNAQDRLLTLINLIKFYEPDLISGEISDEIKQAIKDKVCVRLVLEVGSGMGGFLWGRKNLAESKKEKVIIIGLEPYRTFKYAQDRIKENNLQDVILIGLSLEEFSLISDVLRFDEVVMLGPYIKDIPAYEFGIILGKLMNRQAKLIMITEIPVVLFSEGKVLEGDWFGEFKKGLAESNLKVEVYSTTLDKLPLEYKIDYSILSVEAEEGKVIVITAEHTSYEDSALSSYPIIKHDIMKNEMKFIEQAI